MKKIFILFISIVFSLSATAQKQTLYDFTVNDIDGNQYHLSSLKGKKVMIVNVASKCGFTKQYAALQSIYEQYKDDNFIIIGFPANNFLKQEPGTNEEIKSFCTLNYGVTFPMMDKISVKGKDLHPLYKFLTTKELNGITDNKVSWNFQKYLINPDGKIHKVLPPKTTPDSKEIIEWITL